MSKVASETVPSSPLQGRINRYGKDLTSFDLVYALAVVIMIIDHVGYYFFPMNGEWFRAIGRTGFPVWFTMVGYASSKRNTAPIYWGALILVISDLAFARPLFPLNALVTIILMRFALQFLTRWKMRPVALFGLFATCVALIYPTSFFSEYGTLGLLFGLAGFLIRSAPEQQLTKIFAWAAYGVFALYQQLIFGFSDPAFIVMAAGTAAVINILLNFRMVSFSGTGSIPLVSYATKILGRETLYIYVFHLVLFKAMEAYLWPERYSGFLLY